MIFQADLSTSINNWHLVHPIKKGERENKCCKYCVKVDQITSVQYYQGETCVYMYILVCWQVPVRFVWSICYTWKQGCLSNCTHRVFSPSIIKHIVIYTVTSILLIFHTMIFFIQFYFNYFNYLYNHLFIYKYYMYIWPIICFFDPCEILTNHFCHLFYRKYS